VVAFRAGVGSSGCSVGALVFRVRRMAGVSTISGYTALLNKLLAFQCSSQILIRCPHLGALPACERVSRSLMVSVWKCGFRNGIQRNRVYDANNKFSKTP
jgi:hypothetical protein